MISLEKLEIPHAARKTKINQFTRNACILQFI